MLTYGDAPSGGGLVRQDAIKYQRVDIRFGVGRSHPLSTPGNLFASALPRRRHGLDLDLDEGRQNGTLWKQIAQGRWNSSGRMGVVRLGRRYL